MCIPTCIYIVLYKINILSSESRNNTWLANPHRFTYACASGNAKFLGHTFGCIVTKIWEACNFGENVLNIGMHLAIGLLMTIYIWHILWYGEHLSHYHIGNVLQRNSWCTHKWKHFHFLSTIHDFYMDLLGEL